MSIATGLQDIKKQASFFLKEKIRTARLALTDVTPVQLLTEESTNGNSSAPDAKTMRLISRAAFEIDDYCRIVPILHRRLAKFEKKQWREPYNSLVLLEHLLTHGPERIADEFQSIKGTAQEMCKFQFIDEKGFNWGIVMKKNQRRSSNCWKKAHFLERRESAPAKFPEESRDLVASVKIQPVIMLLLMRKLQILLGGAFHSMKIMVTMRRMMKRKISS